ncbi:MAG: sialate O-acetylesterase [Rubripirellula sp.]|nr:sialate O-acetylesterase [Rubripirellula sp.]
MNRLNQIILASALAAISPATLLAQVSLPHFFSDHMVLQRERSAAIWGSGPAEVELTVSFKGSRIETQTGKDGSWRVEIETGPADSQGADLTIDSSGSKFTIKDVVVGEVWLASGQSNMAFTMNRIPEIEAVIAQADFPQLRMFNAATVTASEPQDDIAGEWTQCTPETAPGYSAVAFFFARKLHQDLNIPVGIIKTAWGGKPVETFTSREALNTLPGTKQLVDAVLAADATYDPAKAEVAYEARLERWEAARDAWKKKPANQRGRLTRKPASPKRPLNTEGKPGVLFDSMIHPFIGYTMKGAIWYQGEANAKPNAVPYDQTLPLMIRDWRQRWNDEFSFYFVQLANFRQPSSEPGTPDAWALLQDRMRQILDTTPKTGMAVINDVGEAGDIHPKNKKAPGERLARWALAKDYGRNLVFSGPLFQAAEATDGTMRVTFRQIGEGLKSRDGKPLQRFEIAGKNRTWHWADARIVGDAVIVSSAQVERPIAVRYAWAANPAGANLVNSEGLPTSVFRSDNWKDVESQVDRSASKALTERRALAAEMKALNARREKLDRKSPEFKSLNKKRLELLAKFRKLAPASPAAPATKGVQ